MAKQRQGVIKRAPEAFTTREQRMRYAQLSKSDWADIYADLYRQCFGEQADAEEILTDANRRHVILARSRVGERNMREWAEREAQREHDPDEIPF